MAHGIVHWEIGGRDLDALSTFYRGLFGWEVERDDEDYRLVATGEGLGGGLMRCRGDVTPYVTVYVGVDDLGATLAKAEALGGKRLVPPTPIPDVGAFALFQDPEGNTIGLLDARPGPDLSREGC